MPAAGVGLAAPQVNKDIRLFIVDSIQLFANQEDDEKGKYPDEPGFKKSFHQRYNKRPQWRTMGSIMKAV
jgi:hypothetical protein